jgi:hypothetical protein
MLLGFHNTYYTTSSLLGSYGKGITFNVHETPNIEAPVYNCLMKFKHQIQYHVTATARSRGQLMRDEISVLLIG